MRMDQQRAPLVEAVENQTRLHAVSLHMPGHKGRLESLSAAQSVLGRTALSSDYTELPGLDDLHCPTGAIREAEALAADLFGAERTWFLVNGTTSGITAALGAVSDQRSVVLTERACHTSVTSGLILSGATPYYLEPVWDPASQCMAGVSVESVRWAFAHCTDVRAIVLTHPSYYGTYSDLQAIVDIAHRHQAIVVVDEAHGAQLAFTGQGIPSAMACGADISVQSTHKMIGSLTQSSMLHVQGERVDRARLDAFISMTNSTSPSYLLMASLDAARRELALHGKALWERQRQRVQQTQAAIDRLAGWQCVTAFQGGEGSRLPLEQSRLVFRSRDGGLPGTAVLRRLRAEHGIDLEFADAVHCIGLVGAGTEQADLDRLLAALREIQKDGAAEGCAGEDGAAKAAAGWNHAAALCRMRPDVVMPPREAVMAPLERLPLDVAEGCIAARDVSVYPPGIPLLRPGERVTAEVLEFIRAAREAGLAFHGLEEDGEGVRLAVAQDEQRTMLFGSYF